MVKRKSGDYHENEEGRLTSPVCRRPRCCTADAMASTTDDANGGDDAMASMTDDANGRGGYDSDNGEAFRASARPSAESDSRAAGDGAEVPSEPVITGQDPAVEAPGGEMVTTDMDPAVPEIFLSEMLDWGLIRRVANELGDPLGIDVEIVSELAESLPESELAESLPESEPEPALALSIADRLPIGKQPSMEPCCSKAGPDKGMYDTAATDAFVHQLWRAGPVKMQPTGQVLLQHLCKQHDIHMLISDVYAVARRCKNQIKAAARVAAEAMT